MTPKTSMPDLEQQLRAALHARADLDQGIPPWVRASARGGSSRRSLAVRAAAAAVVVVAVGTTVAVVGTGGPDNRPALDVATAPRDLEAGLDPVPLPERLVLDLPGMELVRVDEQASIPGPSDPTDGSFHMQSFQSPAGFAGPLLWVLSVPPPPSEMNDYGFGRGRRVTVQGTPARVEGDGPGLRLTWPGADGGGVIMTSWGLSQDELVAVADGLAARPGGQLGWDAATLPAGLEPVVDATRGEERPPAGGRFLQASYRVTDGASADGARGLAAVDLIVSEAGPVGFEDQAMQVGRARSLEAVTVAGRPGLMIESEPASPSWSVLWQPSDSSYAELMFGAIDPDVPVSRDDVLDVIGAVRVVGEASWEAGLPEGTIHPDALATETVELQAGAPLPAGSMWAEGPPLPVARSREMLAAELFGQAGCAWQRTWLAATEAGDEAGASAAIEVLQAKYGWTLARPAYPGVPREVLDSEGALVGPLLAGDVAGVRQEVALSCGEGHYPWVIPG